MSESSSNPYEANDLNEPPARTGFLKRTLLAFLTALVPMLIIPHSSGNSSVSTGGISINKSFKNYGLPTWLRNEVTNGISNWSVDPAWLVISISIAAGIGLFVGWLTMLASPRNPDQDRSS